MPAEERVLCFERKLLEQLGLFQGLSLEVDRFLPLVSTPSNLLYRNRSEAENDRRYKQVIPYVIVVRNNQLLRYRRGSGGEETRLHGKFSIGVGGHISEQDHSLFSQSTLGYFDGMHRELTEEVDIQPVKENTVALINDDSSEVGFVHFGVVHVVQVSGGSVARGRKGIVAPEFLPLAEVVQRAEQYESWSRLCLENIDTLLARAGATVESRQ